MTFQPMSSPDVLRAAYDLNQAEVEVRSGLGRYGCLTEVQLEGKLVDARIHLIMQGAPREELHEALEETKLPAALAVVEAVANNVGRHEMPGRGE